VRRALRRSLRDALVCYAALRRLANCKLVEGNTREVFARLPARWGQRVVLLVLAPVARRHGAAVTRRVGAEKQRGAEVLEARQRRAPQQSRVVLRAPTSAPPARARTHAPKAAKPQRCVRKAAHARCYAPPPPCTQRTAASRCGCACSSAAVSATAERSCPVCPPPAAGAPTSSNTHQSAAASMLLRARRCLLERPARDRAAGVRAARTSAARVGGGGLW
jgi:hypothetical protein